VGFIGSFLVHPKNLPGFLGMQFFGYLPGCLNPGNPGALTEEFCNIYCLLSFLVTEFQRFYNC